MEESRDRRGRRRRPEQSRGLRPLHPELPQAWDSRVIRVAMSESDWNRLESIVSRVGSDAPTQARALGEALSYLIHVGGAVGGDAPAGPLDWLDWERRKTLRLLYPTRRDDS